MRENRTSGSMRRGEKRVMVYSANGHRPERAETVGRRRTCTRPRSPFTLLNVHRHEDDRPQRRHSVTFWDRKMISWRRVDENGARYALGPRYAVLKGDCQ
jgi:hypothetical protein